MIGILLVSHGAFGESLIHCASHVLGKRPLYVRQLGVTVHDDPDEILPTAEDLIRFLDQGQGVLVMTDIYGATPSNIAARLLRPGRVEGIAPEHIPRLTERFYRVDRGRSRSSGGTGLGLAIVKHVLQRHQGRLEIASEPGRGSTFSCAFPATRLAPPKEAAVA